MKRSIARCVPLAFGLMVFAVAGTTLADKENAAQSSAAAAAGNEQKKEGKAGKKEHYSGKPIKALLITGGCCHDYKFQSAAMTTGVEKKADVKWDIVNDGGNGTKAQIDLYDDPDWAKPYDVIIHNECFANTTDEEYIRKITKAHQAGKPALVVHCAMHTYRATKIDDWREFLGVSSFHHEHQSRYPVKVVAPEHPAMKGFATNWVTQKDELYIIKKLWPKARALATSVSEKTNEAQPVVWTNDYHGTRVFGTTYGHSNAAFNDPVFIDLLARGLVWAAGKDASTGKGSNSAPGSKPEPK